MSKAPIDQEEELKSKTQIKNEMLALQALGRKIVELSKSQRARLPLDENMLTALALADKIKGKHDALNRHVQHIGKILREADIEGIHKVLDILANKHQQETMKFHHLEELRDKLIAGNNDDVEALLSKCPNMERQKLKQLIRQAAKEVKAQKLSTNYRDLFKYIRENYPVK